MEKSPMKIHKAAAVLLVLSIPYVVLAQSAVSQAPASGASSRVSTPAEAVSDVDPGKEADIRQLLEVNGTKALVRQAMDGMMASLSDLLRTNLKESCGQTPNCDQFAQLVVEQLKTDIDASVGKLIDVEVPIYASHFSKEDIEALIQFYQTPLGQRLVRNLPEITKQSQTAGEQLGQDLGENAVREVLKAHSDLLGPVVAPQHE
jgi:hypothetical protein